MAPDRKVTFQDPDPRPVRERDGVYTAGDGAIGISGKAHGALAHREAGEPVEGNIVRRPSRRRSPYPRPNPHPDEEDEEHLDGALLNLQNSVSSTKKLNGCRTQADSDGTSDEGDESLQRYKESLGLGGGADLSDPNDPRVCIIQSLTMESPGRAPVVIDLSAPGSAENLKKNPFKIKEGATFTMSAQFKVQHEILSGLHYVQVIKRKGIRIPGGKSDEMIVSPLSSAPARNQDTNSSPNNRAATPPTRTSSPSTPRNVTPPPQPLPTHFPPTEYSHPPLHTVAEETAPTGWTVRGTYAVSSSFVDDDKKTHLQFDWAFEIDKDW